MESLPDWLTPLPDAEAMRAVDRWAIEQQGVPSLELMERAGEAVARAVEVHASDGPVAVVCGKGNNGGDGLAVARMLRERGRAVSVVCVAPPEEFSGDAAANLERLPGDAPVTLAQGQEAIAAATVIVDALLGTGFAGEPHGAVAEAIEAIGRSAAAVVAVDVPSGVDASSGAVAGSAVRAAVTVTFHAAKPGLWIMPGKACAGEVRTVDIGIPRGAPLDTQVGLTSPAVGEQLPRRAAASTKFASGQVLVAGGSRGLTGAPRMAAHASMRAGAGYVIACVPASLQDVLATAATPELMTRGLPERDGALAPDAVAHVIENLRPGGVLALGPGLGRDDGAVAFARELAKTAEAPLVLDADGLNAHAGQARRSGGSRGADRADATCRRAGPAARARQRADRARALAPRALRRRAGRRDRRAEGRRHADRRRRRPRRGQSRRQPCARDGRYRRRAHGRRRGAARPRARCVHGGRRGRLAARGRRARGGSSPRRGRGRDRERRDRSAAGGARGGAAVTEARPTAPRAQASVNVAAIERNCTRLRSALRSGAELCAVVKADGYGHGAEQSARAALAGGASWLAVASAAEARELREAGITGTRILVMGALRLSELREALDAEADVVVWSEQYVSAVATSGGGRVHVKLDSGMGRLGTRDVQLATDVLKLAQQTDGVEPVGLMTHFATADELEDEGFFARQLDAFARWAEPLKAAHPELIVHAANSAAMLRDASSQFDLVRCGIAVYGMDPFGVDPAERALEPALALSSYVAEVKRCAKGESAGYGRRFVAAHDTWLGVLPIGYGDGWRRGLSNNAEVLVAGQRHALVGTVSMDNVTIDLGLDADAERLRGEPAILIGTDRDERITAEEVARRLETINYEITCGLTPRVTRVHHRDGEALERVAAAPGASAQAPTWLPAGNG